MSNRQGTANDIASLDLGRLGTLIVHDDGAHDVDVSVCIEAPTGQRLSAGHMLTEMLRAGTIADDDIIREFERTNQGQADSPLPDSYEPAYHQGHFACNDCHRTFPGKYRGDNGEEVCPDCRGAE